MDFFETVKTRASYRGEFKETPIPEEDIRKIIEAGICAPSAGNAQETSFAAVIKPEVREKIADIFKPNTIRTAPLIIVVIEQSRGQAWVQEYSVEDYAAATENILLAATALGYATLWMDGMTRTQQNSEKVKKILNLDEGWSVKTVIPVGIPVTKEKQAPKSNFDKREVILK